ncbi:hypothetical protein OEZ85_007536 [Tetradesmus obliquus]|uniref:Uncharacterized protein n=1 Tax=Tetradesmus obliquus TaxID=3088 RepID=A0ABY8TKQ0_TETOB|nr:hypothetical protein OEZ85_007536 [Tetradesmus obliquus]
MLFPSLKASLAKYTRDARAVCEELFSVGTAAEQAEEKLKCLADYAKRPAAEQALAALYAREALLARHLVALNNGMRRRLQQHPATFWVWIFFVLLALVAGRLPFMFESCRKAGPSMLAAAVEQLSWLVAMVIAFKKLTAWETLFVSVFWTVMTIQTCKYLCAEHNVTQLC